uniref:Phospholipase A2 n=1 Tax=Branchiostoma floridae TaxID=7739 RepID=C3ZY67_BRAFL|eukprot:XP_002586487.1 hypothetical protein BRAFLDRAFT_75125 [Branchiostoma floridae]
MWWKLPLVICAVAVFNIGSNADPTSVLSDEPRHRQKRNLLQFGRMTWKVTGRFPLDYNNYGCYCGWGGAGIPVDGIDICCRDHDACYRRVKWPKWATYKYAAAAGTVTCSPPPPPPPPPPPGEEEPTSYEEPTEEPTTIDQCPVDLMFLIDGSYSIGREGFEKARDYISYIVGCFSEDTDINVGVIQYKCLPNVDIPLGSYTDIPGLQNAILSDVEFSGGQGKTGAAINHMTCATQFREQVRKVAVVATDGSKRAKEIAYIHDYNLQGTRSAFHTDFCSSENYSTTAGLCC